MILLSTLTAIVLLIAAAVICIHTYEHITRRRTTIKTGENIMADENKTEQDTEEKIVEQPKTDEKPKTDESKNDAAGSHDDELENVISAALKSIGRGEDDKTKEESEQKKVDSSDINIDDIVSRVVERINADNDKKHEDSSKSQTALIAAAIMGAAQPKKEDPWKTAQENLEKILGHK